MTTKSRGFYIGETIIVGTTLADPNTRQPVSLGVGEHVRVTALNFGDVNILSVPIAVPETSTPGSYSTSIDTSELVAGVYEMVLEIVGPNGVQYDLDQFVMFPAPA